MTRNSQLTTIYIVGPTASGKTRLSIELAQILGAEIVSADSQTVRRAMNIGTAKPTKAEMQGVPHHMLDVIDPYEDYSLAQYQTQARSCIDKIHNAGKPAIVVGGTGLYIDALYFDYSLPELPMNIDDQRAELAGESVDDLQSLISSRGLKLPQNSQNKRHLINALLRGGVSGKKNDPDPHSLIVGVRPPRELLIDRINQRIEDMFAHGFVDEVRRIIEAYGKPPKSFDAIGYKIVMRMLDGEIAEAEAKELFKIADRQYAKRQMAWFKRNAHIQWFESPVAAKKYILG